MKKTSVKLRKRKMSSGMVSLYLDIYRQGKREYEYLRLYLVPPTSRADKEKNKETMRIAETVLAKRIIDVQNEKYGMTTDDDDVYFFDYFSNLGRQRSNINNVNKFSNWQSCYRYLTEYEHNLNITFADIDKRWVKGFRDYLDKCEISNNSKLTYFAKVIACFNQAYKDGIINVNPIRGIQNFTKQETQRMYLTADELRLLAVTECKDEIIKRAFLFSALTGMRVSDISRLQWSDVQQSEYTRIMFRQKKTGGQEYLDISPQASSLMTENNSVYVFDNLISHRTTYINRIINLWVNSAGISKPITFHCARHTFAVLMVEQDINIYTISKLLGHKRIATTQIYAKMLDKTKQEAIDKLPDILKKSDN